MTVGGIEIAIATLCRTSVIAEWNGGSVVLHIDSYLQFLRGVDW